jgi:hypothetical protein
MPDEPDEYCDINQCHVSKERHPALKHFRERRSKWLSWLDTDRDHAIWRTLDALVWRDVAFQELTFRPLRQPASNLRRTMQVPTNARKCGAAARNHRGARSGFRAAARWGRACPCIALPCAPAR